MATLSARTEKCAAILALWTSSGTSHKHYTSAHECLMGVLHADDSAGLAYRSSSTWVGLTIHDRLQETHAASQSSITPQTSTNGRRRRPQGILSTQDTTGSSTTDTSPASLRRRRAASSRMIIPGASFSFRTGDGSGQHSITSNGI